MLIPPFHLLIVGMTACGKTHFLLKMLEREFKGRFDYVFLVCPTLPDNETYLEWKFLKDDDVFAIPCEHDEVDTYLKNIAKFAKGTKSLIVLDDCASSHTVKNRTSELVKLGFHGRHSKLSTIVITQQLTSVAKPYRINVSKVVFFYTARKDDRKDIFENYLCVNKEEEQNIMFALKNNKYARLEILTVFPYTHRVVIPGVTV